MYVEYHIYVSTPNNLGDSDKQALPFKQQWAQIKKIVK